MLLVDFHFSPENPVRNRTNGKGRRPKDTDYQIEKRAKQARIQSVLSLLSPA